MILWNYVDTSAAAKLFLDEAHSDAFDNWLNTNRDSKQITSDLTRTELRRALHAFGVGEDTLQHAEVWIRHTAHPAGSRSL
ncbi:hypothetical protein GCM10029992_28580 [Glycomyces albus]